METPDYSHLRKRLLRLTGLDLDCYKGKQMQRRLDTWLKRSGCCSWVDYCPRLERDSAELRRFTDYLTINVSAFFRDPERFAYLRDHVLPKLLSPGRPLRVWSAGASYGAEAYSLAILLEELTPNRRHYLLGTDIDRTIIDRARKGSGFSREDVRNVEPHLLKKYFLTDSGSYDVVERIKTRVELKIHNLLKDPFESDFDLILCRNVVIYFTDEAKEALYRKFHQALRPGGVLFAGGTEILWRPSEIGLSSITCGFYRKFEK